MSDSVYVLLHYLELEENANQTESVDPYLFEAEDDAIAFAQGLMREETSRWDWPREDQDREAEALADALQTPPRGSRAPEDLCVLHVVQLTDSDNEVFMLFRRGVARKGHVYPEMA